MTNLALAVLAWMIYEMATKKRRDKEYKRINERLRDEN